MMKGTKELIPPDFDQHILGHLMVYQVADVSNVSIKNIP